VSSLSSVMDTSLSAMFAAQLGLATTSHNIANADRAGYTRQYNVVTSRQPLKLPFGAIGTGVDVVSVRRAQDDFLQENFRVQTARKESYAAIDSALYEVENIMGSVDNDHLGSSLSTFFNAWSDLATPPADSSLKQLVLSASQSLVNDFRTIDSSLDALTHELDTGITQELGSLNDLLNQVGLLNGQILGVEVGGATANDLRDQRDALLAEIAGIAAVTVVEREDGTADVILNGRTMVTRDVVQRFTTQFERTDDGYRMTVVTSTNLRDVLLPEGRLSGLLAARDEHVEGVRAQLDEVVRTLVESVNALHSQGQTGSSSGLPFFVGDSMSTLAVNTAIAEDPTLIATSRTGEPGDNDIALAIADLANFSFDGSDQTIGDRYRATLVDLASKRSSYEFLVENQDNAVSAVEAKIASATGVSLDEEGANMLRYQNTYNAAAKVISTVQALWDALLAMV
jgi:flagellar hook-associated protein 1